MDQTRVGAVLEYCTRVDAGFCLSPAQETVWLFLKYDESPVQFSCPQGISAGYLCVVVRQMALEVVSRDLPWRFDLLTQLEPLLHAVLSGSFIRGACHCPRCSSCERIFRFIHNVSDEKRVPAAEKDTVQVAVSCGFWKLAMCLASSPLWGIDAVSGCMCHKFRSFESFRCGKSS